MSNIKTSKIVNIFELKLKNFLLDKCYYSIDEFFCWWYFGYVKELNYFVNTFSIDWRITQYVHCLFMEIKKVIIVILYCIVLLLPMIGLRPLTNATMPTLFTRLCFKVGCGFLNSNSRNEMYSIIWNHSCVQWELKICNTNWTHSFERAMKILST